MVCNVGNVIFVEEKLAALRVQVNLPYLPQKSSRGQGKQHRHTPTQAILPDDQHWIAAA